METRTIRRTRLTFHSALDTLAAEDERRPHRDPGEGQGLTPRGRGLMRHPGRDWFGTVRSGRSYSQIWNPPMGSSIGAVTPLSSTAEFSNQNQPEFLFPSQHTSKWPAWLHKLQLP